MSKMHHFWFRTLQYPFGNLSVERLPQFDPERLAKKYHLEKAKSERLADVLTWWYNAIPSLPVNDTMKDRLKNCTMRFSCWETAYTRRKQPDGTIKKEKTWKRKNWRCGCVHVCPWCHQLTLFDFYNKLTPLVERGKLEYILRRDDVEYRKTLFRVPRDTIASIRAIIPGFDVGFAEAASMYFFKPGKCKSADVCDTEHLLGSLGDNFSWMLQDYVGTPQLEEYIQLTKDMKMVSIHL